MLLRWVGVALVLEQGERADEFRACLRRFDYFVDEAAFGGDVRVRELLFKLVHARTAGRGFISSVSQLAAIKNINRSLGSHHRNLCRWPGKVDVGANVL